MGDNIPNPNPPTSGSKQEQDDSSSCYDSSDPSGDSRSEVYEMEPWKYNDNSSNEYESSINQSEASEKVSIDIGHLFFL